MPCLKLLPFLTDPTSISINRYRSMDIANDIGPGLAKATLAGKVDGELVDTGLPH